MAENNLKDIKLDLLLDCNSPESNILNDNAVEKHKDNVRNLSKMFAMAMKVNQKKIEDLQMRLNWNDSNFEDEDKYKNLFSEKELSHVEQFLLNRYESSLCKTSHCSSLSGSFVFLGLNNSSESINYNAKKEDKNASLIEWDTELENKIYPVNLFESDDLNVKSDLTNENCLFEKAKPSVPDLLQNKTFMDFLDKENFSFDEMTHCDDLNIKSDKEQNVVQKQGNDLSVFETINYHMNNMKSFPENFLELDNTVFSVNPFMSNTNPFVSRMSEKDEQLKDFTPDSQIIKEEIATANEHSAITKCSFNTDKYVKDTDIKIENCESSVGKQDNISVLSEEQTQIEELCHAFEQTATCLMVYLEALQNRILKLKKENFEKNNRKLKTFENPSKYECSKTKVTTGCISTSTSLTSYTSKNNSVVNIKQRISSPTYLAADSSKKEKKKDFNSKICACGFCDKSWLEFQMNKRNLSGGDQRELLKEKTISSKISKSIQVTSNSDESSTILKKSFSALNKRNRNFISRKMKSSEVNETVLLRNNTENDASISKSLSMPSEIENKSLKNYINFPEKLKSTIKVRNEKCKEEKKCKKEKCKEEKHLKSYCKKDQVAAQDVLKKVKKEEDEVNSYIPDNETEKDPKGVLLQVLFIFMISGIFGLFLFCVFLCI